MKYDYCGKSGLKLPAISLGLWHNFGGINTYENSREMVFRAFDSGITHFDLANNYGPPPGSAEETFGRIMNRDLHAYRDELVISTKAGYYMWPGPYGEWGSRKYLVSSLDASLKRLGLEYVDIFYSHRPDPNTPIEETMSALDNVVRRGKALYVGISKYNVDETQKALAVLESLGTPCLIHQDSYSMFNRGVEDGLLDLLAKEGVGCIAFTPLAQGLLTGRYIDGIPKDSRAAGPSPFLKDKDITQEKLAKIKKLSDIAKARGQSLAQLALTWVLRKKPVVSAIIGASKPEQITENLGAVNGPELTTEELANIEEILK